jgi:Transglutaminase-like superfamily
VHRDHAATGRCRLVTTTTAYFLSPLSYCREFDDGAIILELGTGTYLGVHAEFLPYLRMAVRNWPDSARTSHSLKSIDSPEFEKLLADLLTRGVLTILPAPSHAYTVAAPLSAVTLTRATATRQFKPTLLAQFAVALFLVAWHHRDKQLASQVDWLRRRQVAIHRNQYSESSDRALRQVACFFRLRIWFYTADQRCLFDSLVLAVFLTRQMIPCTLVIGVSTKPFLAHAWVQIGALVLNDTVEHVQTFTPILVIGETF